MNLLDKIDIKSFDLKELTEKFTEDGIQKYRAKQVFDWLNKYHFDYRGLIPKGLAIEVTKDNNPYEN